MTAWISKVAAGVSSSWQDALVVGWCSLALISDCQQRMHTKLFTNSAWWQSGFSLPLSFIIVRFGIHLTEQSIHYFSLYSLIE